MLCTAVDMGLTRVAAREWKGKDKEKGEYNDEGGWLKGIGLITMMLSTIAKLFRNLSIAVRLTLLKHVSNLLNLVFCGFFFHKFSYYVYSKCSIDIFS